MTEAAVTEVKELSAEDIFSCNDIKIEPVDVPEWGGRVYVKTLSGRVRESYLESIRRMKGAGKKQTVEIDLKDASAKLVMLSCCRKDGTLLFPSNPLVLEQLTEKSAAALQRVVDAASKLNGLGDSDEDEAGNASAATPNGDSSSASA